MNPQYKKSIVDWMKVTGLIHLEGIHRYRAMKSILKASIEMGEAFNKMRAIYPFMFNEIPKHLRYDIMEAGFGCNEDRHPQTVMKSLGIIYQHATPQSIGDQWWFWNCMNMPDKLPSYLTELDLDPMKCIGFGLSQEDAERIRDYKKTFNLW